MMTCPECDKDMHPVCGRLDCKCRTDILSGELPMINKWATIGGAELPEWVGDFLWKWGWIIHPGRTIEKIYHWLSKEKKYLSSTRFSKISRLGVAPWYFLFELQKCPYCGYAAGYDYWQDREMTQTFPHGFPHD